MRSDRKKPKSALLLTPPVGAFGLTGAAPEVWLGRWEGVPFTRQAATGTLELTGGFAEVWIQERAPGGEVPPASATQCQPGTGSLSLHGPPLRQPATGRLRIIGNVYVAPVPVRVQTLSGRLVLGLLKARQPGAGALRLASAPPTVIRPGVVPITCQPSVVPLRLSSAPPTVLRPANPVTLVVIGDPAKGPYAVEMQTTLTGALVVQFFVDGVFYHQESVPKYSLFGGDDLCATGTLGNGTHLIEAEVKSDTGTWLGSAQLTLTEGPPRNSTIRALVGTVTLGLER